MGTHSGPTPPVRVCEGGHVGTSSSTATPRGVTWSRGGGPGCPPATPAHPGGYRRPPTPQPRTPGGRRTLPALSRERRRARRPWGCTSPSPPWLQLQEEWGEGGGGGCRAGGARSSTHPARSRGCPCSSPAGRPRGARLLPPRRWAVGGMGCQAWGRPVRHGAPRPVQGVVGVAGVPHLLLQRGWALCTQSQRFLPTGRSALGRALAAAPRPLPDHI